MLNQLLKKLKSELAAIKSISDLNKKHKSYIDYDVKIVNIKNLSMRENVQIQSGSHLNCGGMEWSGGKGFIKLGTNVFIGPQCVFFGAGGITIGDDCLISPSVKIMSHEHNFNDHSTPIYKQPGIYEEIVIMNNVYIGANATILPGVTIGEGCVIGAGAVVTTDIPPYSVAVGVPAKVIKFIKK